MAAVTSRGYVGILKSVCMTQIEVAPRVYFNYSPSVEHLVLLGAFFVSAIARKTKEIAEPCKQKGGMYDPDITRRSKENS